MSSKQTFFILLLALGVCLVLGIFLALVFTTISAPRTAQTGPSPDSEISPAPTNTSSLLVSYPPTPRGAPILAPLRTVVPTPGMMGVLRCGNYNLTQQVGGAGRVTSIIISTPDGKTKKTLKAEAAPSAGLQVLWCSDLTGSGPPDVVFQSFSGNGRCCFTYDVISMTENFPVRLHWEANNGQLLQAALLSGHLPYELVGTDDRFATFDSMPLAESRFVPIVFAFRNGKFTAATREYPSVLREDQTKAQEALKACSDDPCQKSSALRIYADGVWLNEDSAALANVKTQVKPPVAAWLESVRANVLKILAK